MVLARHVLSQDIGIESFWFIYFDLSLPIERDFNLAYKSSVVSSQTLIFYLISIGEGFVTKVKNQDETSQNTVQIFFLKSFKKTINHRTS